MWGYENYLLINCTGKNLELKRNLSISTSAVTKTTASDPKRSATVGGSWLHRWHSKGKTSKWQQYHSLNRCASWRWNVLLCVFVCTPICVWESWDGQRKKRKRERVDRILHALMSAISKVFATQRQEVSSLLSASFTLTCFLSASVEKRSAWKSTKDFAKPRLHKLDFWK